MARRNLDFTIVASKSAPDGAQSFSSGALKVLAAS